MNDRYFTIHITPQEECSYISFESNVDLSVFDQKLFQKLYQTCQPQSFDILLFQMSHLKEKTVQGKAIVDFDTKMLGKSYQVHFITNKKAIHLSKNTTSHEVYRMSEKQDDWIYEEHRSGLRMGYLVKQKLFEGQSDFQKVSVYDTKSHGRMLFNDDLAMVF